MSKKASVVITKNRVQTSQTEGIAQPVTAPLPKPSTPQPLQSTTPSPPNKSASSTFWASNPMVKQQQQPPSVANTTAAATTTQSTAADDGSVSASSSKSKRPRASPATTTTTVVAHPPTPPTPLEQPVVEVAQGATKGGKQNADVTAASIPRVINVRKAELCARGYHSFLDWAAGSKNLYIGRSMVQYVPGTVGSKWGNPFPLKKHSLEESLRLYEAHVRSSKELWGALEELAGLEEIGCWCAPAPCHGNVLQRLLAEKLGQQAR